MFENINFFSEDINYQCKEEQNLKHWIYTTIEAEQYIPGDINIIFCSDEYLLNINKEYLKHHTLTDIITFDYVENKRVSGDIFISIERVQENANAMKIDCDTELKRVMIHGVLHLCGYTDKNKEEKQSMRNKEDQYLHKIP